MGEVMATMDVVGQRWTCWKWWWCSSCELAMEPVNNASVIHCVVVTTATVVV